MKIKGRFIAVLAAVGLLAALLPALPTGAAAGRVTLSGGSEGQYFSDVMGKNIVTVSVTDADLSPVRYGKVRYGRTVDGVAVSAVPTGDRAISIAAGVIGGESPETDNFDGGITNVVCDLDRNGTNDDVRIIATNADPQDEFTDADRYGTDDGTAATTIAPGCESKGAAVAVAADFSALGETDDEESAEEAFLFTLEETARDANNDGIMDNKDFTVVVNNNTLSKENTDGYAIAPGGTANGYGVDVIRVKVRPNDAPNSVTISYESSEYNIGNATTASTTPIQLTGTEIHYGGDQPASGVSFDNSLPNELNIAAATSDLSTITATAEATNAAILLITIAYNVQEETKKDIVTVASSTFPAGKKLSGGETGAATGVFTVEVALFNAVDYAKIEAQAGITANDNKYAAPIADDVDTLDVDEAMAVIALDDLALQGNTEGRMGTDLFNDTVQVDELNNRGGLGEGSVGDDLQEKVNAAANALDMTPRTTLATDLLPLLLSVSHGDVFTATYADISPANTVVSTAEVDLEAPEVNLISPAHDLFTGESLLTLSAEVTDEGAGVERGDIIMVSSAASISHTNAQISSITNGFKITNVSTSAIPEGSYSWLLTVEDKVGNVPVKGDAAPRGAAAPQSLTSTDGVKSFTFSIDVAAPTVSSAITGRSLDNVGVTSGAESGQESEEDGSQEWVRVTFNLGPGNAPLDPASVQANDFLVAGGAPLEAVVNSRNLPMNGLTEGSAVYLKVAEMLTDARPRVQLTGDVRDKAGNARTSGNVGNAIDGIAPKFTVTPGAKIAQDEMTVTVVSSERLPVAPILSYTTTKPAKGKDLVDAETESLQLQTGSSTVYSATIDNTAKTAQKLFLAVEGRDLNANVAMAGRAASKSDVISFQLDSKMPRLKFYGGLERDKELGESSTTQQEGAVWIVTQFDDDEHSDSKGKSTDAYRTITVTSLSLTDKSDDSVIASDVSALFGGLEDCADQEGREYVVTAAVDAVDADDTADPPVEVVKAVDEVLGDVEAKCDERTLAIDLAPGEYNLEITATDTAGNSVTDDVDFEVGARKPFELELKPGVNLVSIPGNPVGDSGNLNVMLEDFEGVTLVTTYDRAADVAGQNPWLRSTRDPETGLFTGDIPTLQPGAAYFITSDARVTVEIALQRVLGELPPTMQVRFGYNTVGYWSIEGTIDPEGQPIDDYLNSVPWTVAYSYDPTPGMGWQVIRPGSSDPDTAPETINAKPGVGYLIFSRFDATLTP